MGFKEAFYSLLLDFSSASWICFHYYEILCSVHNYSLGFSYLALCFHLLPFDSLCVYIMGRENDPSLTATASFPIAYFPFSDYWVSGTSAVGGCLEAADCRHSVRCLSANCWLLSLRVGRLDNWLLLRWCLMRLPAESCAKILIPYSQWRKGCLRCFLRTAIDCTYGFNGGFDFRRTSPRTISLKYKKPVHQTFALHML
jgi:hypothetical protein